MNFVDKNCYSLIFKALEQYHYIDGLSTLNLKEYTTTNNLMYPKKVMNMNYLNLNKKTALFNELSISNITYSNGLFSPNGISQKTTSKE